MPNIISKCRSFFVENCCVSTNNYHNKKGYITLEASLLLPIFIIGIVTLLYIIKFAIAVEGASAIGFDHARRLSRDFYEPITALGSMDRLEKRLEQNVSGVESTEATIPLPLPYFAGCDEVLFFKTSIKIKRPYPVNLEKDTIATHTYVFRPFVGKDNSSSEKQNPQEKQKYREVWVFPKAGGRYHIKNCTYIEVCAIQETLTAQTKLRYKPCPLCKSRELSNGDIVYCFPKTGKDYHRAECSQVDRYVVSMDLEEAIARGYLPCTKCGGYDE